MKIPKPRRLKSGNYFIQLRLNGESIPITAPSARECSRRATLIKAQHIAGARRRSGSGEDATIGEIVDKYINTRRAVLSPATVRSYTTIRATRFKNVMNRPFKAIKSWQVIIDEEAGTCSEKTLKNAWALVATSIKFHGISAPTVRLPAVPASSRPWLDSGQIAVFCAAVHGEPCEIPALLALHSLRRSEIAALKWKNIDLRRKTITVSGAAVVNEYGEIVIRTQNKTKESARTVPIMIPRLLELVAAHGGQPDAFVLACEIGTLRRRINAVCKRAGLPAVGVHGLRHSFASLAHHLRMPAIEAMRIGGWADLGTMHKIYTHVAASDLARAANAMEGFYKSLLSDENANESANDEQKQ